MTRPQTLPHILLQRASAEPERVCQRKKDRGIWRRYTWAQVLANVRDLALELGSLGLRPGQTVAAIGENDPEHFWTEYAAQAMGGKFVSLYPALTPEEMHYLLSDAEAAYLVAEDQEQFASRAIQRMTPIPDGTTEIQKLIIARNILGVSAFGDEGAAPPTTSRKGA